MKSARSKGNVPSSPDRGVPEHLSVFFSRQDPRFDVIFEAVDALPIDDTHCHLITDQDAVTTPQRFLERISLTGFPIPRYFPDGVYVSWLNGDEKTKYDLNKTFDIQNKVDGITANIAESIFIKFLVKELASYLGCRPTLNEVIEARNERGSDYWSYVNGLFRDTKYKNIMLETGVLDGRGPEAISLFEDAILPCQSYRISRIEQVQGELFGLDISFDEFEDRYIKRLHEILDGNGNFGKPSYGMKSYLLPDIGLIRPLYERRPAELSWQALRKSYDSRNNLDREESAQVTKDLCRYTFTLALEECLKRNRPIVTAVILL